MAFNLFEFDAHAKHFEAFTPTNLKKNFQLVWSFEDF